MSTDQALVFSEILEGFAAKCSEALVPSHPVMWEGSNEKSACLRLVVLGVKEVPSEWRGQMRVKKIEDEEGGQKEILVNPSTMWEVRVAAVPVGGILPERLLMLGQVIRCLRDDGRISVRMNRWNGLESDFIAVTFAAENPQDRSVLLAVTGDEAGLATIYVLTIGLDSGVKREFTRITERDLRTKKIQEDS